MSGDMHSFIVRVWKEGVDRVRNATIWRCSVDNVVSGERSHLAELEDIGPCIREQVEGCAQRHPLSDDGQAVQEGL